MLSFLGKLPSWLPIFLADAIAGREIGQRIKLLNKKLHAISRRRNRLALQVDTRKLLEVLLKEGLESVGDAYAVVAIIGAGGIGKTTLARKVFNHAIVQDGFQKLAWVDIPQDLTKSNVVELFHKTINQLGGIHHGAQGLAELQPILKRTVTGSKILLVMDDVWSVEAWEWLLMAPLRYCAPGSRIIITTRNREIGLQMKAIYTHRVTKLSAEDGWTLLKKLVIRHSNEVMEIEKLRDIGEKIIEHCGCLPLAICTVGGVLRTKTMARSEWQKVLKNSVWSRTGLPEDINKVVLLSYEDLPGHLKQCFLYCSLLPKRLHIMRPSMSQYWIAEGFVQTENCDLLEEIAEDYFRQLVSRNLLEPDKSF